MNQDPEAPTERLSVADDRFGICPVCGGCDDCLNIGRTHWMTCRAHRLKWNVGENLFRSWRHETAKDWERNADTLKDYSEVAPAYSNRNNLPNGVAEALDAMLDHFWQDEAADYQASPSAVGNIHVFRHMLTLDSWMRGVRQRSTP